MSFRLAVAALLIAPALGAQELVATPYDKCGIYKEGQTVGWTVALGAGQTASAGAYPYRVMQNGGVQIGAGAVDFTNGAATIETKCLDCWPSIASLSHPLLTIRFAWIGSGLPDHSDLVS